MSIPASATLTDAIRAGYERGFSFTPLNGKRPTQSGWQKAERPSLSVCLAWAERGNVGLRTGTASGIIAIDVDPGGDVSAFNLPDTVTVITGRDGWHFYFLLPANITIGNSAGKLGKNIDVRGEGGQVVYVGSTHPDTGKLYEWADGLSPDDIDIAPLPQNIIDALTTSASRRAEPTDTPAVNAADNKRAVRWARRNLQLAIANLHQATTGTRNDTLNKSAFVAGTLVSGGYLDRSECVQLLMDAALTVGLERGESEKTIASGIEAGEQHPRVFDTKTAATPRPERHAGNDGLPTITPGRYGLDLAGNVNRFMHLFGKDVRWCEGRGVWLIWDGTHWRPDDNREINHLAEQTMMALARESMGGDDAILKWATACNKSAKAKNEMLTDVKHRTATPMREFDAAPWLFNAANGTVDLRTGLLLSHDRSHLLTKISPASFDPEHTAERWLSFLADIMPDQAMIDALQRLAGYFLTADIGVQILPIFYGAGGNGKNVFLDTLLGIMGPYAEEAPEGLITSRNSDEHPTEIAGLQGKRLIVASETEEGRKMRIGLVKKITGNKFLTGRFMRQDYFTFERTHKTVVVTNNRPVVSESTNAIWRRLRLIPFDVTIPESKQDRQLTEKLIAEWPGILAWIVAGCLDWQSRGCDLEFPEAVYMATEAYKDESDHVGEFIAERCVDFHEHPDQAIRTPKERVYDAYCKWARDMGIEALGRQSFGRRMRSHGFEDKPSRSDGKVQKCWMHLAIGAKNE